MRLTQLEIFGFKSFAQKIVIPFDPGITAIVGPNGCGKSNVVEAIRWVLGEQRAGTFRSHRMEDVIFGGSRNRKPLGMAEVNLIIENTGNLLPIEFSEVTLTRRLFRSGESDYLMNKIPCRLLDIANLLMDTGLGQGAYAVIEQGMVDEIISERTENRRRILEEAAGITKYKARRRSTWNKLESTQGDLTRIEDIINEVKRQVDYLSRQVGRARRYQALKKELDDLEVLLGRFRFFALFEQLTPLQKELERLTRSAEEGYTHFTTREAELEQVRLAETQAEKQLQAIGLELNQRVDQIHEQDGRLIAVRERLEAIDTIIARTSSERQDYEQQRESAQQQRQQTTQSLATILEQLEDLDVRLEHQEEYTAETEQDYTVDRAALDDQKRQLIDKLRIQNDLSRSLERLQAEREGLLERTGSMETESATLAAEQAGACHTAQDAQQHLDRLGAAQQYRTDQQQRLQQNVAMMTVQRRRIEEQHEHLARLIEANQARLQVMEKVHSGYQGYSSGVRTLLLNSPYHDLFCGVLGDLLEVDPRYLHAVETALGEALEALVSKSGKQRVEAIEYLKERLSGRAGIFSLAAPLPSLGPPIDLQAAPGLIGPLRHFVHAPQELAPLLETLLHNTFLVENLSVALHLRNTDQRLRLVTPQGDAIDLCGRVAGGQSDKEDASLLGRRQEIRALRAAIASEKGRLAALQTRVDSETMRHATLTHRSTALAAVLEELKEQERAQTHRLHSGQQEASRLQVRLDQLQQEHSRLEARSRQLDLDIDLQEERLETEEQQGKALESSIRQREEQLHQAEAARREQLDRLAAMRVERARVAETSQSLKRDAERLQHLERNLQQNIERLAREVEQAHENRRQLAGEGERIEAELEKLHQERDQLNEERDRRQQHWAEVNVHNRELEESISRLQRELNALRDRRHQLELQIAQLQTQSTHLKERLEEEQHCDVEAMGPLTEEVAAEAQERRIGELRQSLLRLGVVDVKVLEEYEEQKERYDFLCQQRDDLLVATEDLKKTLRLIDRTARQMFVDTFAQISQKFKETFTRFFPGGEADLQLQPEVDPLEAAIEIIARPRGKRLQNIALLSGGERALTAISLLFGLYLVKPSPFCILDEVDAPLDDANIGRFVRVLKEFARSTQFIMVTHNKISMAAANALHGVTMPEEGVSQLVSVRVEEERREEAAG